MVMLLYRNYSTLINVSDLEPFQGGRNAIDVSTFFKQVFDSHKYYLDLVQVRASDNYYMGAFFDWVPSATSTTPNSLSSIPTLATTETRNKSEIIDCNGIQEGFRWRRLGVKPSFKEGGMLGPSTAYS